MRKKSFFWPINFVLLFIVAPHCALSQNSLSKADDKADAITAKAVQQLGGDKYLRATSQYGRGQFSVIKDGAVVSFQTFADVIVYPDKERTEFKGGGAKTVQVNVGNSGWLLDGDMDKIRDQTEVQIRNFKNGLRVSLDNLLRGHWRKEATLTYVGQRPASLGKRNDVVRLTYNDGGTSVEFEFSDDGLPAKAVYKHVSADGEEMTDEDHYAQFVDVNGIKAAFIVDHFINGKQSSRINYESIEFNKSIPESSFAKPSNVKDLKKDMKL